MTSIATPPTTQPSPSALPRERRRTSRSRPGLLALPALLWLTAFVVVPTVVLASYSFLTSGFFTVSAPTTLENFRTAVSSELTRGAALNSLIIGAGSAVTCLVVGIPTAYWLRYHAGRLVAPVLLIVTLSMFASYLVRIYAWRTILGERGVLNSALSALGITDQPMNVLLFNKLSILLAMVHISLPFVIVMLYSALRPLEPRYLEAARDLGAGNVASWRRLILPVLAAPAFLAGAFVFILTSADYVTAQFLGGPGDSMVGVQVSGMFSASGNYAGGASISVLMLLSYALLFGMGTLLLRLGRLNQVRWTT